MKAGIYDNSTLNSSDEDLSVSQLHFSVLQRASSKAVLLYLPLQRNKIKFQWAFCLTS